MARRTKIYKTKKRKKKKITITAESPPQTIPIQTAKEKVQEIDFNQRYYRDLLDRL